MSQSTTMKVVLVALLLFFTVAIGFTIYESYRSVASDAGETENQGYEEIPFSETPATETTII